MDVEGGVAADFRSVARRYRNELAVIDGDRRLSYGDLAREIDRMKNGLHVSPGEVIGETSAHCWQFVARFFAVVELGGVFFPGNPQWTARENRSFAEKLKERNGSAPAAYLATSGSTGVPRIVPRSHRNLTAGARNVARTLDIGPGHRFVCVTPFHHSNGFHNTMLMPLLHGACILPMPDFSPAAFARLVRREGANVLIASPFVYGLLADTVASPGDLAGLKLCLSAGARMPDGAGERWRAGFGIRVGQLYGSTETSVVSIDCSAVDPRDNSFVGNPIHGVEVRCSASGELAVKSEAVMSGYLGEPPCDEFFLTGDLGSIDAQGGLRLTGRVGRIVNLGGVKVDPVEIERVLERLPGVSACFVDAVGGAIRARVAVGRNDAITRGVIIEHCRNQLAEYKLPRLIEILESLPLTTAGKMPA